ncbi:hypothetical protein H4R35_003782 [Dimargaris xerosporica]|nr:hypothetical protein H4R35_003782 [Dimargaris xerosporica]
MLGKLLTSRPRGPPAADLQPRAQELCDLGLPLDQPLTATWSHHTPVPAACRVATSTGALSSPPCMLGVDEAGRGPVLGPMVYGICYCPLEAKDTVARAGFDDSKALTEAKRDQLFDDLQTEALCHTVGWAVTALSPQDISSAMLRRLFTRIIASENLISANSAKYNLNAIAHDTTIGLIRATLERGVNVKEVYVDTVGPPEKYQAKLARLFPGIKITVAKKADSLYPIVSAASICAKVIRDAILKYWQFAEGQPLCDLSDNEDTNTMPLAATRSSALNTWSNEFGSGYPSDPSTVKWLKSHMDKVFGFPGVIRFGWSTCSKMLDDQGAAVHWPGYEDSAALSRASSKRGATANTPLSRGPRPSPSLFRHVSYPDLHKVKAQVATSQSTSVAVQQSRLRSEAFFTSRRLHTVTALQV